MRLLFVAIFVLSTALAAARALEVSTAWGFGSSGESEIVATTAQGSSITATKSRPGVPECEGGPASAGASAAPLRGVAVRRDLAVRFAPVGVARWILGHSTTSALS